MHGSEPELARSEPERERLAKAWLVELIGNTPMAEIEGLALPWVAANGAALVEAIVDELDPLAGPMPDEQQRRRTREAELAGLRVGAAAAELIARDLAALHRLLLDALRREAPELDAAALGRAASRLATVFGRIQATVSEALVERRGAAQDPMTGLPTAGDLEQHLLALRAEHRRYAQGFALALLDVDGLGRVNDAYGREAGDRMINSVAGLVARQLRATDSAYRLSSDEFAIVAPHGTPSGMEIVGRRLASLISSSQVTSGPRLAAAIGIACCPEDGDAPDELLQAAEEATYAAKAAGLAVMIRSSLRTGNGSSGSPMA